MREVCDTGPYARRELVMTPRIKTVGCVLLVALLLLELVLLPEFRKLRYNAGSTIFAAIMVAPASIVLGAAWLIAVRVYERHRVRFTFPYIVNLPAWGVYSHDADTLVLARRRSSIVLLHRENTTLDAVLDALDPEKELLEVERDAPVENQVEIELPGTPPLAGIARALGANAYVIMLGPESDAEMIADAEALYLPQMRPRSPLEPVQEFRPTQARSIARARVV